MTLPRPDAIAALEAGGADAATVAAAWARWRAVQPVYDAIERAFAGVGLGDGIGLWQAQAIDDYADAATCAHLRERDEKHDWRRIPIGDLNRCYSSVHFFDAAGMRFHLPAFLLADLRGEYDQSLVFVLTEPGDYNLGRYATLSPAQRAAVRGYLQHIAAQPEFECEREEIEAGLAGYWAAP